MAKSNRTKQLPPWPAWLGDVDLIGPKEALLSLSRDEQRDLGRTLNALMRTHQRNPLSRSSSSVLNTSNPDLSIEVTTYPLVPESHGNPAVYSQQQSTVKLVSRPHSGGGGSSASEMDRGTAEAEAAQRRPKHWQRK